MKPNNQKVPNNRSAGPGPQLLRERTTRIALALPEAEASSRTGQHTAYTVRGKKFAYFLNDHHGDGRIAMQCKAPPGEQGRLIALAPDRYFIPPYMGQHGWVGLYLDRGRPDWAEVERLLVDAYLLLAPKKLAAALEAARFS
jgi:phosphoribosylglycinamide formyltransferase-1